MVDQVAVHPCNSDCHRDQTRSQDHLVTEMGEQLVVTLPKNCEKNVRR